MIFGATYKASGNHERTCVSEVVSADSAGLASLFFGARERAITVERIADSVCSMDAVAVTSTDSLAAPTSRTTSKTAHSHLASGNSRTLILNPTEEIWIWTLPAAIPEKENSPSCLDVSI